MDCVNEETWPNAGGRGDQPRDHVELRQEFRAAQARVIRSKQQK